MSDATDAKVVPCLIPIAGRLTWTEESLKSLGISKEQNPKSKKFQNRKLKIQTPKSNVFWDVGIFGRPTSIKNE